MPDTRTDPDAKSALRTFTGELKAVTYSKPEGQWGIFKFFNLDKKLDVTVTGVLYPQVVGKIFILTGWPDYSEKFKQWQLKLKEFKITEQQTDEGIINYLSREGPNIGPVKAEELVKKFGKDTMKIMRDDPQQVAEKINGFTLERANAVATWLLKEQRMFAIKEKLYAIALTQNQIGKIIAFFGVDAPELLKTNCFDLTKIDGIGFLTAAKIADKVGIPTNDPNRIRCGVKYALQEIIDGEGHSCIPHDMLIRAACKILGVHKELVIKQTKHLIETKQLIVDRSDAKAFVNDTELYEEIETLRKERNGIPQDGNRSHEPRPATSTEELGTISGYGGAD